MRRGAGAVAIAEEPAVGLPASPYRGIRPFRYADHPIFFAREEETHLLTSLVAVYRGVLLYGDSGAGKSSLVNAGLLPRAQRLGYDPVRVRVQPRAGEELVIERIPATDDDAELAPCVLTTDGERAPRVVVSIAEFERRVRSAAVDHRILVVIDQFEELLTLFEDDDAVASRGALCEMLVGLLREPLPVKIVLAFREDYLGRVKELLAARPELVDQALRLGPPSPDALRTIIRGPFERFPGRFDHELRPELADTLSAALSKRFGSGDMSLSEVQTVCLRLWQSRDPADLLATKGVQGLLEDELGEALDAFAPDVRAAAIALLSAMVTSAGTRNVVSAEDLRERVHEEHPRMPDALIDGALERLERDSKLVRRERRRDIYLYEITSEFLVPWISRRRDELELAQARRRERRRLRILASVAGGLLAVLAIVVGLALFAFHRQGEAQRAARTALSRQLAAESAIQAKGDVGLGLSLSLAALSIDDTIEARRTLLANLLVEPRIVRLLDHGDGSLRSLDFTRDGRRLVAASIDGRVSTWDVGRGRALARSRVPAFDVADVSARARVIATASSDSHTVDVRKLDSAVPAVWRRIRLHEPVDTVLFAPDGRRLVIVTGSGKVRIQDVAAGRKLARRPPDGEYAAVGAFTGDGRTLALARNHPARVELWDVEAGALRSSVRVPGRDSQTVTAMTLDPAGRRLTAAVADAEFRETLVTLDVRSGAVRWRSPAPNAGVRMVAVGARTVATAFNDGGARIGDAVTGRIEGRPLSGLGSVNLLEIAPDGRMIASADDHGRIGVIAVGKSASTQVLKRAVDPANGYERGLAFTADGRSVVLGKARRAELDVLPLRGAQKVIHVDGDPGAGVKVLAVAPRTGTIAVTTTSAGTPRAMLVPRSGPAIMLKDVRDEPSAAAFSPDGHTLALGNFMGAVTLWNADTGEPAGAPLARDVATGNRPGVTILSFDRRMTRLLWSDDATRVLSRPLDGHDRARAVVTDADVIAIAPDQRVVVVTPDRRVEVRDPADRRSTRTLLRLDESARIEAAAVSPDSSLLAVAHSKGLRRALEVFDLRAARLIGQLPTDEPVDAMAFSPTGQTLAVDHARTVSIWRLDAADLRTRACAIVGNWLSAERWRQYVGAAAPYRANC